MTKAEPLDRDGRPLRVYDLPDPCPACGRLARMVYGSRLCSGCGMCLAVCWCVRPTRPSGSGA